jgi:hypothetical protein
VRRGRLSALWGRGVGLVVGSGRRGGSGLDRWRLVRGGPVRGSRGTGSGGDFGGRGCLAGIVCGCRNRGIRKCGLIKYHMSGNKNTTRVEVEIAITFMFPRIPYEDTTHGARS